MVKVLNISGPQILHLWNRSKDDSSPYWVVVENSVYKNLAKCQAYDKCYTSAGCEYFYDIGEQDIILALEHLRIHV